LFEPLQLAPGYALANAERDGEAYAASLGAHSIADLRRLPGASLLRGKASLVSHPVIGTAVLPLSPWDAYRRGKVNDVPVLIGSNAEEARSLTDVRTVTAKNFEEGITAGFGSLPAPLLAAYPHSTDVEAKQARLDFERDLRFGWDMWTWARLQAQRGRVFYYRFGQHPPFPEGSVRAGWGASHFAELWYMFDHLDQESWRWTKKDRQLADAMTRYWANFARSGNPNGPGLPTWPAFEPQGRTMLELRDTIRVKDVPERRQFGIFDAVYGELRKTEP
jgi:para-nitrobenzyl esterase